MPECIISDIQIYLDLIAHTDLMQKNWAVTSTKGVLLRVELPFFHSSKRLFTTVPLNLVIKSPQYAFS